VATPVCCNANFTAIALMTSSGALAIFSVTSFLFRSRTVSREKTKMVSGQIAAIDDDRALLDLEWRAVHYECAGRAPRIREQSWRKSEQACVRRLVIRG
jgi:hypothetical protein